MEINDNQGATRDNEYSVISSRKGYLIGYPYQAFFVYFSVEHLPKELTQFGSHVERVAHETALAVAIEEVEHGAHGAHCL
jgi:hypothetical protein